MSLKLKRNYPIIVILVVVLMFLTLVLGNQRVIAYTTQTNPSAATKSSSLKTGIDYSNKVALFDDSVVHRIQVIISDENYNQMLTTYKQTGLKEYVKADIVIDGVRVNNVGIRLKGNASLRTALGGGMGGRGGFMPGGDGNNPAGGGRGQPPAGGPVPGGGKIAGGAPGPGNMPQDVNPGEAPMTTGTAASKLPFLVKINEFEKGQSYQGYNFISIRNYGTSTDAAMLQEPVTNEIVRLIGLPATQTSYAGVRLNDKVEQLYVISEILDENYLAKYFDHADGVLYKSEVGSTLSYLGENPSSYARAFTQETRENDADLLPLIGFMRFLSQSDDAAFESELASRLDVDSFASYLAVNALLANADSMIGMNNNYYLYYDEVSQRFTLLMWDANESLGKMGGNSGSFSVDLTNTTQSFRGPGGGSQNLLQKRFIANAKFKALYEQKLEEIYQKAYTSGALSAVVDRYSALITSVNPSRNLVNQTAYDQAVQMVKTFITRRTEYLKTTAKLGQ